MLLYLQATYPHARNEKGGRREKKSKGTCQLNLSDFEMSQWPEMVNMTPYAMKLRQSWDSP